METSLETGCYVIADEGQVGNRTKVAEVIRISNGIIAAVDGWKPVDVMNLSLTLTKLLSPLWFHYHMFRHAKEKSEYTINTWQMSSSQTRQVSCLDAK